MSYLQRVQEDITPQVVDITSEDVKRLIEDEKGWFWKLLSKKILMFIIDKVVPALLNAVLSALSEKYTITKKC